MKSIRYKKRKCFELILVKNTTKSERRKDCDAIKLLTEKNNGYVK